MTASVAVVIILVALSGCGGGRDTGSVQTALQGHWKSDDGKTHYYIGETFIVMLDEGRRMDQTYTVLESNESQNWIDIRVKTAYESGHDKHIVFDAGRDSLTTSIEILGSTVTNKWLYVDSKQGP